MKRTRFDGDTCPVARAAGVAGDWWSLLVVRHARPRGRRYGECERAWASRRTS